MGTSPLDEVRAMYDDTADGYARMMDAEIALPVYADVLGRLQERIAEVPGPLVDAACGSGHMLAMYQRYDPDRALWAVDLSPRMVAITAERLGSGARVEVGDMRALPQVASGTCAAVLSFYALHHLDADGAQTALAEWYRVLGPGGQLVVATWEGSGPIDYGEHADIVALRYQAAELRAWAEAAGFEVSRCLVAPVEDFPMDAVHLEASRPAR